MLPTGLPPLSPTRDHCWGSIHVHLSCHSTGATLTAQSGQAGVRSGSHLPSVRGVRHAQLSLSTARLAVNAVRTLLGVLPAREREQLLVPTLPALARMCRARLLITFCQRLSWLREYPEQWVCGWLGSIFFIFYLDI